MLPLEGMTVIAVEQAVAAPFCSSRLADAGANVIKIERPEGDFARGYDAAAKGQSSYFVWLNRGKSSEVVDLTTADGKKTLETLIALLNAGIHPRVPRRGSVGASGDLAPLAHLALVLVGEGEVIGPGDRVYSARPVISWSPRYAAATFTTRRSQQATRQAELYQALLR